MGSVTDAAAAYERFLSDSGNGAELRRRYRRLALHLHPDRGGAKELFQTCHDAYVRLLERFDDGPVDMDWEPTI